MSSARGILISDLPDLTPGRPPITYSTPATMACLLLPVPRRMLL